MMWSGVLLCVALAACAAAAAGAGAAAQEEDYARNLVQALWSQTNGFTGATPSALAGARTAAPRAAAAGSSAAHSGAQHWLQLLAQYARSGGAAMTPAADGSLPAPFAVDLPVDEGGHMLPLLVLPVPVLGQGCSAQAHEAHAQSASALSADSSSERSGAPQPAVTSQQLVQLFAEQAPGAPHLPPAVFPLRPAGYLPPGAPAAAGYSYERPAAAASSAQCHDPAPPRLDRSLFIQARLTVPRADYTEHYTVKWDARTGSSRVEHHEDGATVSYRTAAGGRLQRIVMRSVRSGGAEQRECLVSSPAPADHARHPALPDLDGFVFQGCRSEGREVAEVWARREAPGAGAGGAARGESLTFHHELVLRRSASGSARPIRYSVSVDSSVLGARCDGWEHRYDLVREEEHAADTFLPALERECSVMTPLDWQRAEQLARLEPLREFTLPTRDPAYDVLLAQFKQDFGREYADDAEEAVRKNLFVQHSRFVSANNRQGARFETEVNFLCDRLDAELDVLLGVMFEEARAGAAFPHSAQEAAAAPLEREWDWRDHGAVTPPRYQGSCSSCWAFAVTGSVEGALFLRTRRLVPLAEQALVDCAHVTGAHGCNGTWPSFAFDYVKERGLPQRDQYSPYQEKVLRCRDREVAPVTHISGHVDVTPNNVDALKLAIRRHAPTVVVIDAKPKSFMFYKKGVLQDERCRKGPKKQLNHAVLAVGWGEQRGEPHFIIKNTYSAKWGDGGYVRLHAPSNTCGVLTLPQYARLRPADVDRLPAPAQDTQDLQVAAER